MFSRDFMRPEVWHALSVHFPIALLPVATITMLIAFFIKKESKRSSQLAATLLLLLGCLTAWIAVFTGDSAESIVARKICDPTVLKDHEIAGENTAWLFTAALAMLIMFQTNLVRPALRALSLYAAFILMLTGTGFLVYTGHIGATLVYEQGAGVKDHDVDCSEYE